MAERVSIERGVPFHQKDRRKTTAKFKVVETFSMRNRRRRKNTILTLVIKQAQQYVDKGYLQPLPRARFVDVIELGIKMPKRVYIVGTGPNGVEHFPRIPADAFTIVLNKAIYAPVPKTIWAAMDTSLKGQQWFVDAMEKVYKDGHDLHPNNIGAGYVIPVMEKSRVARFFTWVNGTFELDMSRMMQLGDVAPLDKRLRPGCTVAGAMTQLSYICGAEEIVLNGIDMFGGVYFDGSKHKKPARINNPWGNVARFNQLFQWLRDHGMKIWSLSKTQLEVDLI